MNPALFQLSLACFLLLPPLALAVRWLRPYRLPWWGVAVAVALGSWLFGNAAVYFHFEHLGDLLRAEPSNLEVRQSWEADGAKRVFAFSFGWLYVLVYAIPFLLTFGVAHAWRRRGIASGRHAA